MGKGAVGRAVAGLPPARREMPPAGWALLSHKSLPPALVTPPMFTVVWAADGALAGGRATPARCRAPAAPPGRPFKRPFPGSEAGCAGQKRFGPPARAPPRGESAAAGQGSGLYPLPALALGR